VQWDFRANEVAQKYDEHAAAVNTITFIDENRKFVSSSDDKRVFIWEYGVPVVLVGGASALVTFLYVLSTLHTRILRSIATLHTPRTHTHTQAHIADPGMHSMPARGVSKDGMRWLGQSQDNQVGSECSMRRSFAFSFVLLLRWCERSCDVHLCSLLCCSLGGASALVTFICVRCTLRAQISRSI
jgi:hypothetical protein